VKSAFVVLGAAAALAAVATAPPVKAQEIGEFTEVRLVPGDGTSYDVGDRSYRGQLRLRSHPDGLALVELVAIDGYLAGIREVPATWPEAALDAQAVAARTYLAWTLDRGRSPDAATYDFDICATTQCQVYAGTAAGDRRWVDAVARTSNEILLFEGRPAQTMYFSTSGGQTEPIQDIFAGATAKPYLQGAPSPDEPSPFVSWSVEMPVEAFSQILEAAGYPIGEVRAVEVDAERRGGGVWHMVVTGAGGTLRIPVAEVRSAFNRFGPELFGDMLPALRPDGRRYPQVILSYRFEVRFAAPTAHTRLDALPPDDRPASGMVSFRGRGWGHHVGMSQYGALAMAERGEGYAAILAHYYGGLLPEPAPDVLPAEVAVGLAWGEPAFVVRADGPLMMFGDGVQVDVPGGGTWIFRQRGDAVAVISGDLLFDRLLARLGRLAPLA
jgi:stage II sporulation protein D